MSSSYCSSKHPNQAGSNPSYLVTVPLVPHITDKHLIAININLVNCQSICSPTVKYFEKGGSNSDILIAVSMSSHSTVKHVNSMIIGLVNFQSVCIKYDDIADYDKDLDLDALVIT